MWQVFLVINAPDEGFIGKYKYLDTKGNIYKILKMFSLENKDADSFIPVGIDEINKLMTIRIPFNEWIILFVNILMSTINSFFKSEGKSGEV